MIESYMTRQATAEYLTSKGSRATQQAMADMASDGVGPPYSIVRGRALYRREDVDAWLKAEFERGAQLKAAPVETLALSQQAAAA